MTINSKLRSEINARVAATCGRRRVVTMNTASQIGMSNFYGDEAEPRISRKLLCNLIECALENWGPTADDNEETWADGIISDILADVKA